MSLNIQYYPSKEKIVRTADRFRVIDQDTKLGLEVVDGMAQLIGYCGATAEHDHRGYMERFQSLTPELLCAFVDAYRARKA